MVVMHNCGFTLPDHPPYSPDLAPSDNYLSPNMKKHLARRHYRSDEEMIAVVEEFFRNQDEGFYITWIQGFQHRWRKFVDHKSVLVLANNRIMVGLRTFQPCLVFKSNEKYPCVICK